MNPNTPMPERDPADISGGFALGFAALTANLPRHFVYSMRSATRKYPVACHFGEQCESAYARRLAVNNVNPNTVEAGIRESSKNTLAITDNPPEWR